MTLIRSYMSSGHFKADLDPLNLKQAYKEYGAKVRTMTFDEDTHLEKMDYRSYAFSDAILDRKLHIDLEDWGGLLSTKKEWTLRELIDTLEKAYCGKIGVEYMHIPD